MLRNHFLINAYVWCAVLEERGMVVALESAPSTRERVEVAHGATPDAYIVSYVFDGPNAYGGPLVPSAKKNRVILCLCEESSWVVVCI
jgi:hypothetical protein